MAVTWKWNEKLGEINFIDIEHKAPWHLDIYNGGNCMAVIIYNIPKSKDYKFFTFLEDMKHAKALAKHKELKLEKLAIGNHKVKNVTIHLTKQKGNNFLIKEALQLSKLLVELGYKVILN